MSPLDLHKTITTDDPDDALERLRHFYRENGYEPRTSPSSSDELIMTRGKSGSSWWSSNMTELDSRVEFQRHPDSISLHVQVDVSGQYLTDSDRSFWNREIGKATEYASGQLEHPPDLRMSEQQRAEKGFGERISLGVWGAVFVALLILLLGFFGYI